MRVLSWNLNGRTGGACRRQLDRVVGRAPEIVALQEVTRTSYPRWSEGLLAAGYSLVSTIDLVRLPYALPGSKIARKYFNMIASREPITPLPGLKFIDPEQAQSAFPEKYIAALVRPCGQEVDVHNAHLPPGSSRGEIKVFAFEAIRRRVDEPTRCPRILCGDFNTPRAEDAASVTT